MSTRPTQHRVLKQLTLALAGVLERGLEECFGKAVPVRLEYQEQPARTAGGAGKADPHLTLVQYWVERSGDRVPDRVLDRTPDGEEFFRAPPLMMVARYAITAWAPAPDDQELLGAAVRILYDTPELEASGGKDEDAIHFEDKPQIELSGRYSLDEHRMVCEAYNMPLRPSVRVNLLFRLDSERKTPVKRVKERIVDYRKMD